MPRLPIAWLLAAMLTLPALAQSDAGSQLPRLGGSEAPAIRFERFGLTDGLAQSSINYMIQDRHGFLWIAT